MQWRRTGWGNIIALNAAEVALSRRIFNIVKSHERRRPINISQIRRALIKESSKKDSIPSFSIVSRQLFILSESIPTKCVEGTEPPLKFIMKQTKRRKDKKYYIVKLRQNDNNQSTLE